MVVAPQGHFRRAGRSYLVGSEHVTYRDLLCWLETYLGLCRIRGGPEIRRAFGNRVELANLSGQLLGKDLQLVFPCAALMRQKR